jgi:hypothetical protein
MAGIFYKYMNDIMYFSNLTVHSEDSLLSSTIECNTIGRPMPFAEPATHNHCFENERVRGSAR